MSSQHMEMVLGLNVRVSFATEYKCNVDIDS